MLNLECALLMGFQSQFTMHNAHAIHNPKCSTPFLVSAMISFYFKEEKKDSVAISLFNKLTECVKRKSFSFGVKMAMKIIPNAFQSESFLLNLAGMRSSAWILSKKVQMINSQFDPI